MDLSGSLISRLSRKHSIIAMTRLVSARSANCKFRGRIRGRLALSAVQMAQLVLIYLLFARSLGKEKDACMHATRPRARMRMHATRCSRYAAEGIALRT